MAHSPTSSQRNSSLPQLSRWFSKCAKRVGLIRPVIVLWPGKSYSCVYSHGSWNIVSTVFDEGKLESSTGGTVASRPAWAKKLYRAGVRKALERECHWICHSDGQIIALVTFDRSPGEVVNTGILADLLENFEETIVRIHALERLHFRIAALQHCLRFADRLIVISLLDGTVVAATNQGHGVLGRLVHGEGFSAHTIQEVDRLPPVLENSILNKKSQIKLSPTSTAAIKPWGGTNVSTLPPRFEIEIFTELAGKDRPLPLSKLTYSERRVFDLLVTGRSNKEIAREKKCSVATVRHQLASAYDKLGIRRREELIAVYHAAVRSPSVEPLMLSTEMTAKVSKLSTLAPGYFAGKKAGKI